MQTVRPDLSKDQEWAVLQVVDRQSSGACGITWDTLLYAAEELDPVPDTAD
jgi:hypothetical protein